MCKQIIDVSDRKTFNTPRHLRQLEQKEDIQCVVSSSQEIENKVGFNDVLLSPFLYFPKDFAKDQ